MGHTRLGTLPKTRKWNELAEQIAGEGLTSDVAIRAANIRAVAARTLDAAQSALYKASDDPGVRFTFYLLTQIALASRTSDWEHVLSQYGINLLMSPRFSTSRSSCSMRSTVSSAEIQLAQPI